MENVESPAVETATKRPQKKSKSRVSQIVLPVLLLAIIGLVASTMRAGQGALTYSKYVDEVVAQPNRFLGQEIRVEGMVVNGSIQNAQGSNDFRFRIERNHREMPVHYTGIVPDTFRQGIGVTVRGRLTTSGVFEAREVLAKCPTKYEMQSLRAQGTAMPGAHPANIPQR